MRITILLSLVCKLLLVVVSINTVALHASSSDLPTFLAGLRGNSAKFPVPPKQPEFVVLVSLSMGPQNIRNLGQQCQKMGCRVVLRGLVNNSFQDTQKLFMKEGLTADLDPPLFEALKVKVVPTFALVERDATGGILGAKVVVGNIMPSYAYGLLTGGRS